MTIDDDDEDAKMMELENENIENQSNGVSIAFDDDDEIREMTENVQNIYLKERKKELESYDVVICKFLGKGWKDRNGEELVMMAMELREKKEYAVFLKHNKDSCASRHERLEALAELEEEIDNDWGAFLRKSTDFFHVFDVTCSIFYV